MNKLLLLALVGFAFIALSGAEEQEAEGSIQVASQAQVAESREVRDADPAKNKERKKAKKGKKKGKKVKKNKKKNAKKNNKKKSKKNKKQGKKLKKNKRKGKKKGRKLKNKKSKKNKKRGKKLKKNKNKKRKNKKTKGMKARKNKSKKGKKGKKTKSKKGKKGKKNKSKKAKKGKKNKKNKNKKGKKSKKNKKNKSGKKGKKNKKSKKAKKAKNAKKSKKSGRTCGKAVSDDCLNKAVTYMKMMKDKVGNFKRQFTRIGKQNGTGGKKSGKKDVFKGALTRLIETGGGNVTSLSCGGSTDNTGAKQLKNLTDTLKKCSDNIKKACDPSNLPAPNITEATACNNTMTTFSKKVEECRVKSGTEACTCWTKSELTTMEQKIRKCALSKKANEMAAAIKKCREAFQKCRKYEDDVGSVIHTCAVSKKSLLAKLKSLKKNKAELTKLKDKITALSKKSVRSARQITTCAAVISTVTIVNKFVMQNPASTLIFLQASKVTSVTVTCTSSEKTSLKALIPAVAGSILAIERETAAVQATVKELGGKEATDAEIDGAGDCGNSDCSPVDDSDSDGSSSSGTTSAGTVAAGSTDGSAASKTTPKPMVTTKAPKRRHRKSVEDILKSKLVQDA